MGGNGRQRKATARELTPAQEQAVELIAQGSRMGETAAAVGIHRVTLWEWTQQPAFEQALARLRSEVWRAAADRMRRNVTRAAAVVGEVLDDANAIPRDRLLAARLALDAAGPLFGEAEALEQRDRARPKAPSWSTVVRHTAERAARMLGGYVVEARTPGQAWAEAGLTRDTFAAVDRLRKDPVRARAYCDRLLASLSRDLDREAFEEDDEGAEEGVETG